MTKSYKDWLNLDVENLEPIQLPKSKKIDIKKNILVSHKKKPFMRLRHLSAAAIFCISAVTVIGFTFPTVASQIPFMQNVFSYFQDDMDVDFEKYATAIGQVQTDNGISVMIDNAIYDGTAITVSYAVETDQELGDRPREENFFDIEKSTGWSATGKPFRKVSNTTYVGLAKITPKFANTPPNEVILSWEPYSFTNTETNTEFKGDWQFEFKLTKLESNFQLINESIEQHGVTVVIKTFETNDMSTVIHYEQFIDADTLKSWDSVTAQFDTIQDNLGNTYLYSGNTSTTSDNGRSWISSGSIRTIDPNATSLTFVPTIYSSLGLGKGVETKDMEPIVIDLQK
ncbi:DUF4179 domain-containing protein [Psychrobacillus sp.]|uniref:DUF4179 domain-containing protein n=1 Tax=Psychrobacillus sp. TaxID=1871623 RepID=UPI0028BF5A93|nr:DUF4179 domain-containing protein [Psychrobacillus sp.]